MPEFEKWLTMGRMALRIGVMAHQLKRLVLRNEVPSAMLCDQHILSTDDEEVIRAACVRAGYLKKAAPADQPVRAEAAVA